MNDFHLILIVPTWHMAFLVVEGPSTNTILGVDLDQAANHLEVKTFPRLSAVDHSAEQQAEMKLQDIIPFNMPLDAAPVILGRTHVTGGGLYLPVNPDGDIRPTPMTTLTPVVDVFRYYADDSPHTARALSHQPTAATEVYNSSISAVSRTIAFLTLIKEAGFRPSAFVAFTAHEPTTFSPN